jgi:hypothetical protein
MATVEQVRTISDVPLHEALAIVAPVMNGGEVSQSLIAAKCAGLLAGYDQKWRNAPYRIEDVECVVSSDLWNPESGRKSRSFSVSGKIDVRAVDLHTGAAVIFDHKTCSQDISDPNGSYWRQLVVESQPAHYMLIEWLNDRKVDYAIWDAVRKPGIAPKALAKKDAADFLAFGQYFGSQFDLSELERFREVGRETPAMYAARLAHDCSTERPEWYFQRRPVPRLDAEIREYAGELWDHGQDLLASRASGRMPRNSGACMTYGSPCKFLGVCSGHDSIDSEQWAHKTWIHPELPRTDGDGRDVLTNTRIRCFQTCRRKHQYQYEIGVERIEEEEREALLFGDLFHRALEAYFLALKHLQHKEQ